MRKLNDEGSVIPVAIYFILLGAVSAFMLIFGDVLEPIVNIMPDGVFKDFISLMWPLGIMLVFFFALTFALFQSMQKTKYQSGGGYVE